MEYKNEICDGCQKAFSDGDDIVVCPVCGTPQHRSCWQENNDCVNAHLHADGFVWQKSEPQADLKVENEAQEVPEENSTTGNSKANMPPVFTQLAQEAKNLESVFLKDEILHKDEEIDGVSVTDAAYYLQSGANKYIKRFRKNKKVTWNWGAFFFSPAWFFYRKLYKVGAIFLSVIVAINLFSYSFAQGIVNEREKVYTVVQEVYEETNDYQKTVNILYQDEEFMANYIEYSKHYSLYALITTGIPNLIAALTADIFVKKKMKRDIENAKSSSDDLQVQRSLIISKGGVAPFIFACVYFASDYLVSFLISIGSMFTDLF